MAKLPTVSSQYFNWKAGRGSARLSRLALRSMPDRGFYIKSERTGEVKLFLYDAEMMEANEFFDGEAVAFMSPGGHVQVQIWVGD